MQLIFWIPDAASDGGGFAPYPYPDPGDAQYPGSESPDWGSIPETPTTDTDTSREPASGAESSIGDNDHNPGGSSGNDFNSSNPVAGSNGGECSSPVRFMQRVLSPSCCKSRSRFLLVRPSRILILRQAFLGQKRRKEPQDKCTAC